MDLLGSINVRKRKLLDVLGTKLQVICENNADLSNNLEQSLSWI